MNNLLKYSFLLIFLAVFSSCEDDLELPDNTIEFESDQLGFSGGENELIININFSRASEASGNVEVEALLTGLQYGSQFTTDPALEGGKIVIPVDAGATSVSFKIIKVDGAGFVGDEQIKLTISSTLDQLVLGDKSQLTLVFSEIVATLGSIDPTVGGDIQPNKVFVDLSGSRQYSVGRGDWDLGFYTAEGQFRVILNSSTGMLARLLDKSDLNQVTATDTVGFGEQLSLAAIFAAVNLDPIPDWISESVLWMDDPAEPLTKTAIAEISATDADNKVYIVNRGKNPDGSERGWKKIRIIRSGSGYTLQHADISATSFQSISVSKDDNYVLNYVHFENGNVAIEPKSDQWDIAFTVFTNTTPTGPPGSPLIPFEFRDFVIQNLVGVETAQVLTSAITYENFGETDITGITFSTSQRTIGSSWRSIPSNSSTPPSVRSDRFYIVKDGAGNVYKIRFTALTKDGVRGNPSFEFALVKKGS